MGIDRSNGDTDDPAEANEEPPPPDRRPPPDRPGAEGVPSRADSRAGAAAANETGRQATPEKSESKPEVSRPSSQEAFREQDSIDTEGKSESPVAPETTESSAGSDETSSERHDTSPTREDDPGHHGPGLSSAESGDHNATSERGEVPGGQASPPDNRVATKAEASAAPPDTFDQFEASDPPEASPVVDSVGSDWSEEPSESLSNALVESQRTDQGLSTPDDSEPAGEKSPDAREARPPNRHLTVDGMRVNERLDPSGGADAGSDVIGEPWGDPTDRLPPSGEKLVKMDRDDASRPEKVRKKFFEVVSDAHDITGKAANKGHDIFAPPPTGHAETYTAPELIPAPHDGVNAGDLATGLFVLGTLFGEGIRRSRRKLSERN